MRWFRRFWGLPVLLVALAAWVEVIAGKLAASAVAGVILALSAASVAWFLFQTPLWCRAANRDGTSCRNNSRGLLIGCRLRQHKWQRLQLVIHASAWRELNRKLWASTADKAATLGGLGSAVSAIAAVVAIMVH